MAVAFALSLTGGACSSSGGRPAGAGTGGAGGQLASSGAAGSTDRGGSAGGGIAGRGAGGTAGVIGTGGTGTGGAASGGAGAAGTRGTGGAAGQGASGGRGGSAGSATDGGTPPAACAGLFCEDFESGKLDPAVWNVQTFGGQTVVVQKGMAAHGMYAAQFHALPNILSYDLIITKHAPAALAGHHFGRAYFYVTPMPPTQHMTLLFAGSSGFPTFKRLEVASYESGWQLTSVDQTGITSSAAATSGTTETYAMGGTLPVKKWFCLEWEFNDTPDLARVFVDGKEDFTFTPISLGGKTSGQVGGFSDFGFGFYIWHPATYAFDVYYDDIVLDTKRVNCLP